MRTTLIASACAALLLGSPLAHAASDDLRDLARNLFEPIPEAEVLIKEKALTEEQIELGKWLFFEPRLSNSHIITCNTCHSVGTGNADNIPTSIGHGWQAGP